MDVVQEAEGGSPGVPMKPLGEGQAEETEDAAVGVNDDVHGAEGGIEELGGEPCSQACRLRKDRHNGRCSPALRGASEPSTWTFERAPDHQSTSFCLVGLNMKHRRRTGGSSASQQHPDMTHAVTCRQGRPRTCSKPHMEVVAAGLNGMLAEEAAADQKDNAEHLHMCTYWAPLERRWPHRHLCLFHTRPCVVAVHDGSCGAAAVQEPLTRCMATKLKQH